MILLSYYLFNSGAALVISFPVVAGVLLRRSVLITTKRPQPSPADPPRRCRLLRPSLASPCCALLLSRVEEKVKDRGQELEEAGGSNCEAMTHLNSAPKDLFADV